MAAFIAAILTCYFFSSLNQWLMLLTGHLSATLVVFISSQIFKNSSLYDPFWSVAPLPIAIYISIYPESGEIDLEKIFSEYGFSVASTLLAKIKLEVFTNSLNDFTIGMLSM